MNRLLFWVASGAIAWTYGLFPLVLWARASLWPRPVVRSSATPPVTVIVPAHNEEMDIGRKLRSVLEADYPADCLEVIVASDGSTDGTVAAALAVGDRRVRVLDLRRAGKAAALNAAVAEASGEILVFTDANSMVDREALRAIVAPFADAEVGGVAGDQRYEATTAVGTQQGERRYWDFERRLKLWESMAGSTVSSTGALHAVRANLVRPVPDGLTDDFFISTGVIRQGHRLVFEPDAIAHEPAATSAADEFDRKVRIATRIFATEFASRDLLNPFRYGFYAIQLLSHKPMRQLLFVPLGVIALVTPSLVSRGIVYRVAAVGQLAMYGFAAIGLMSGGRFNSRLFSFPAYFCMTYAAQMYAAIRLLRGERVAYWTHARTAGASSAGPPAAPIRDHAVS